MEYTQSINPATGLLIERYALLNDAEIDAAMTTAEAGARAWAAMPVDGRAGQLSRLAIMLRERAEDLACLITAEMGKPIAQARGEVEKCAGLCDWYAANGPTHLADQRLPVDDDGEAILCWQPVGIVLAVMPWNFPLWQAMRAAVPIMLAGNGFVLKHADNVQGCAHALASAFVEAGFPAGAFTNLPIGRDASMRLIGDRRVAAVTVTAGVGAGAAIAAEAGRHIKKSLLELGGIDPFIVLADADLDAAADAAVRSRFLNSGQVCIAAKRWIVEEAIAAAFTDKVVERTAALKVGDPMDEANFIGPLSRERGRQEVDRQIRDTIDAGGRLLLGGEALPGEGYYYAPTILAGVSPTMAASCQELFGPAAAILTVPDADAAVTMANDSAFGLSAALWTNDAAKGQALARRIETGAVFVNGISASDPRVPIGGVKQSGYGRELSWLGLHEFANAKTIWAR
jgi:acyl-CoA reductase-like NAD-dependent aldehyde dehydrogenase